MAIQCYRIPRRRSWLRIHLESPHGPVHQDAWTDNVGWHQENPCRWRIPGGYSTLLRTRCWLGSVVVNFASCASRWHFYFAHLGDISTLGLQDLGYQLTSENTQYIVQALKTFLGISASFRLNDFTVWLYFERFIVAPLQLVLSYSVVLFHPRLNALTPWSITRCQS